MADKATLRVWRGTKDKPGEFQEFEVETYPGMVVLDAIHDVQATQDPNLAVRWNCKAGRCGSCSAEINGRPRLLCMTRMSHFEPGEPITVTPMKSFPLIRDLVTDISHNYRMAKKIPPFKPRPREADGTWRMQQHDIDRIQEFRKCIECFLCQDVCHVLRDHDKHESFAGPRFMIQLANLDMHPLDTVDRRPMIKDTFGIGYCNITRCCTEVCPENITITDNGIIPLKERIADDFYDPVKWLLRKVMGTKKKKSLPVVQEAGSKKSEAPKAKKKEPADAEE
ncbi:MAG: succinate dehydrogenase/fumarate reductase iron-sulfur subunit [Myxococcales bacterium]|nr:succinate dehydrogenase/fumarate reductase iron-sulfur subunit [Myxococcales bacterium]